MRCRRKPQVLKGKEGVLVIRVVSVQCPVCSKSFKMECDYFDIGEKISCLRCDAELEIIAVEPIEVRLVKPPIKKQRD